jgi:3-hydroxyacyl-[acyl-carrier-protein] dehydratase
MDIHHIKKRLHHRSPFLFLDRVSTHTPESITAHFTPGPQHFFIQGHFPDMPIVPGSMMQEMTTQAAGLLISEHYSPVTDYDSEKQRGHALGVLRSVQYAKYKSFARPGDELEIKVSLLERSETAFRFKASIEVRGKKIMANEFTLVNISDEKLRGELDFTN